MNKGKAWYKQRDNEMKARSVPHLIWDSTPEFRLVNGKIQKQKGSGKTLRYRKEKEVEMLRMTFDAVQNLAKTALNQRLRLIAKRVIRLFGPLLAGNGASLLNQPEVE